MAMALELQFEYIDWNDIVDAELSGDVNTLESLRCKSEEIKRSFSCPVPKDTRPTSPKQPSPTSLCSNGYFKVPRKMRAVNRPAMPAQKSFPPLNQSQKHCRPFESWDEEYPVLLSHNTGPFPPQCTSPITENYAMVLSKRTFSERNCLSPVECEAKRSALVGLVASPPTGECSSQAFDCSSTPKEFSSSSLFIHQEQLEYRTPDNDSRAAKSTGAVQRRLFPTTKENTSPRCGSRTSSDTKELSTRQISQRQKQLDFGKNTLGYQRYLQTVPKWERKRVHPITPDKAESISTRCWQGRLKAWRKALHIYDPPNDQGLTPFTAEEAALCDLDMSCELPSGD